MKLRTGVAYKQLSQTRNFSDDDDSTDDDLHGSDDDVIFDRGSKSRLLVKGSEKLGEHVKLKIMGKRPRKRKYKKNNEGKCNKTICKICVILSLSLLFIGCALTIPVLHWHKIGGGGGEGGTVDNFKDWHLIYNDTASESIMRLLDVDDDGKDDLLIGIVNMVSNDSKSSPHTLDVLDDFKGILIAVRGYDGKELWRTEEFGSSIMFMNCHDIDVNKDGRKDCIVTGRKATIVAIDVRNGKILWTSKSKKHYKATWNIYQVSVLPDFTSDGIPELLVTHGGDPKAEPDNHKRESGRLILISGVNGKPMGNFYSLPQFKETYMTSVIYTRPLGDQYILYGAGGETVPGALLAISVPDFYRNVSDLKPDAPVPMVNVSLYTNPPKPMKKGVMTLISGKEKGVMVPPIIVDVNNDSVPDILVSLFEGKMVLLDGKTLDEVWTAEFPNSEFYSTPAPGYFDEDDHLDFMFHVSQGAWMVYNYTRHVVISGKDGSILWQMVSNGYDMSSDLVVKTTQHCDLFIFRVIGRKKSDYSIDVKNGNIVHNLHNRSEHIDQEQNPTADIDQEQSPTENIDQEQNPTEHIDQEQNRTMNNEQKQHPTENIDQEQKQNPTENIDQEQNPTENIDQEQNPTENIDQEQNPTEHSDQEQNPTENIDQEQNPTENIDQEQNPTEHIDQEQNRTTNIDQKQHPTENIDQEQKQNPTENIDQEQNPLENIDQEQNPTENIDQKQNPTENIDQKQNPTENIDQKQNPTENTDQEQNRTADIDQKQNPTENIDQEQNPTENIDQKQNPTEHSGQEQNPTENIDQEQNPTEHIDQEQNQTEHIDQEQNRTANMSETSPLIGETTPNISETTPNLKSRLRRHETIEVTDELYDLTAEECIERKKDYEKDHIICGPDSVKLDQEILIVGRATNYQPIKVLEAQAMEYKYDVENKQCGAVGEYRTLCVLSTPDGKLTGSVGNLDGGSNLQLVAQIVYNAKMVDDAYEYRKGKQKFITKLQRVDLRRILETGIKISAPIFKTIKPKHQLSKDVHFLAKEKQRWLEYLGSNNYNVY